MLTFYRKDRGKKCDESLDCGLCFVIFVGGILSVGEGVYFTDMSNLFARNEQVYQTASLSDIPDILTAETAITSLEAAASEDSKKLSN